MRHFTLRKTEGRGFLTISSEKWRTWRRQPLILMAVALGASLVGGCDHAKQALGLKRKAPDEFGVVNRPPLSVPPGLSLQPPAPGLERPQDPAPQSKAKDLLLTPDSQKSGLTENPASIGQKNLPSGGKGKGKASQSEECLLKTAGTEEGNPEIRKTLDQETAAAEPQDGVVQKMLYWQKKEKTGEVINPNEEHKRLYGEDHPVEKVSKE